MLVLTVHKDRQVAPQTQTITTLLQALLSKITNALGASSVHQMEPRKLKYLAAGSGSTLLIWITQHLNLLFQLLLVMLDGIVPSVS